MIMGAGATPLPIFFLKKGYYAIEIIYYTDYG